MMIFTQSGVTVSPSAAHSSTGPVGNGVIGVHAQSPRLSTTAVHTTGPHGPVVTSTVVPGSPVPVTTGVVLVVSVPSVGHSIIGSIGSVVQLLASPVHTYPGSTSQVLLHPSPFVLFPSSQLSDTSTMPSPHMIPHVLASHTQIRPASI